MNSIARFIREHRLLIASISGLSILLVASFYLRIHNLADWFNYVHDYDEGVYTLAARFIAQGLMPYRDFPLPSPPLHELAVAGLFKVFHYDFMIARYLSVAFSLLNVILIFVTARRTLGLWPGFVAAAIFSFDPILVYLGRRAVHESLGLTFCLVGLLFLTFYLSSRRRRWLALVGVAFGLSLTVKLTFLPLVAGAIVAVALLEAGLNWRSLARFGTTRALLEYLAVAGFIFALLVLLNVLGFNVPLPVINQPLWVPVGTRGTLVGFAILFAPLLIVLSWHSNLGIMKAALSRLWQAIRSPGAWTLVAATVLTFGVVIMPFLLAAPQSVLEQVFLIQTNRTISEAPTYLTMLRYSIYMPGLIKLYALPILVSLPVLYLLLRCRTVTDMHSIMVVALTVVLLGLQMTAFPLPRYYVSVYPILALGVAAFFTDMSGTLRLVKLVALGAFILLLGSLSFRVPPVYSGYDVMNDFSSPQGRPIYGEVSAFISTLKPNAKVYSTNPTLLSLSPGLRTVSDNDAFGRLSLADKEVSGMLDELDKEGVDFIVLDPWVRWWVGDVKLKMDELQAEVRRRGRLVHVVGSTDSDRFEIYAMSRKGELIFNSDFRYWPPEAPAPLGWELLVNKAPENGTSIKPFTVESQKAVALQVHQTTTASPTDWTHLRIRQTISLPAGAIQLRAYPTFGYKEQDGWPVTVAGVEVSDEQNHLLWYTFAELKETSRSHDLPNGHHIEVLDTPLNQWSTRTINIKETYRKLGWSVPDKVTFDLFLAVHMSQPGTYSTFFGPIQVVLP